MKSNLFKLQKREKVKKYIFKHQWILAYVDTSIKISKNASESKITITLKN